MAALLKEDIASKLLHSSDARIAEAAKRVFSSTYPGVATFSTAYSPPHDPLAAFAKPAPLKSPALESTEGRSTSIVNTALTFRDDVNSQVASFGDSESVGLPQTMHDGCQLPTAMDLMETDEIDDETKPSSTERIQRRSRYVNKIKLQPKADGEHASSVRRKPLRLF